jgi:hypothetical protein
VIHPPSPVLHSAILFGTGAVLLLVVPLLPPRSRVLVALIIGCSAALTLGVFAVRHALVLRHRVGERGKPAMGGITERPGADGRVILDLPGEGLEPWGSDAWSVLLCTIALSGVALSLEAPSWTIFVFLAALILALGLRLRAARRDFIRIELERDGWAIDALEGGRRVEIRGTGALLPELLPEALLLWADSGRIGTIRWELAPEERAWLAERFLGAAERGRSLAEPRHEVDQPEPDHHRQQEEPEQAQ